MSTNNPIDYTEYGIDDIDDTLDNELWFRVYFNIYKNIQNIKNKNKHMINVIKKSLLYNKLSCIEDQALSICLTNMIIMESKF